MKRTQLIGTLVLTAMLAACQPSSDLSVGGHSVTLHATNAPTATITSRGSFSVDDKDIAVTPEQRQMLIRYYNDVTAIHEGSDTLKDTGMAMAGKSLRMTSHSIKKAVGIGSSTSVADKADAQALQAKGQQLSQQAQQLCQAIGKTKALQASIAMQITAFKPYAKLDPAPGVNCRRKDGGQTSFTRGMEHGERDGKAAAHALSH